VLVVNDVLNVMAAYHPVYKFAVHGTCTAHLHTGKIRSSKLENISLPCEPIGSFVSTYPRMPGDPAVSLRMVDGNVSQNFLALWH